MSTLALNFRNSTKGLSPEVEKQAHYFKQVAERAKRTRIHLENYYSKATDSLSTSIGTIRRGVGRKVENAAFALFGKNPLLTLGLIDDLERSSLELFKDIRAMFSGVKSTAAVAIPASANLTETFSATKVDIENVDQDLALKFQEHVNNQKLASAATAESIAKSEFIGPLPRKMHELTSQFMDKTATTPMTRDEFEAQATRQLLEDAGIIFSKTDPDRFALSRSVFEALRNEFETPRAHNSYSENAAIFVFNNAVAHNNAIPKEVILKLPVTPTVKPPAHALAA